MTSQASHRLLLVSTLSLTLSRVLVTGPELAARQPPALREPNQAAQEAKLSTARLVDTDWRLYSSIFAVLPVEGYPFRFRADGSVVTKNLAGARSWQLGSGNIITLQDDKNNVIYRFSFDSANGVLLTECGPPALPMVLGPKGTNFFAYLAKRCPHQYRIASNPSRGARSSTVRRSSTHRRTTGTPWRA